ncbi:MAG: AAA family ATPase, partial [Acidimicrobiia bacterium]
MTDRPVLEVSDARRVWAGDGLVAEFNAADVVRPADVHAATRLARLLGESDDRVILAAALALRGTRFGHVCVDLETVRETMAIDGVDDELVAALPWPGAGWIETVAASPMTGTGEPDRPLVLEGSLLYTQRMWDYQARSADRLLARAADPVHAPAGLDDTLDRVFPGEPTRQREAAALALSSRLTVIAGGPGTGKTYTIARIIGAASELAAVAGQRPPLVALAAPTGKAANRLTQQLQDFARSGLLSDPVAASLAEMEASTIHRMLSSTFGRNRFTHHADNPLPHDLVIVDEMSMVPLSMATRVLDATRPEASLILVGDPNQLASIEAGTVLADLVGSDENLRGSDASKGGQHEVLVDGEADSEGSQIMFAFDHEIDPQAGSYLFPVGGTEVTRSGSSRGCRHKMPVDSGLTPLTNHVITLDRAHRFAAESPVADLADAIRRGDADAVMDHLRAGREGISWIDPGDTPVDQIPEVVDPVLAHARRLIELAEAGEVEAAIAQLGDLALMCAHRRGPVGVSDWVSL